MSFKTDHKKMNKFLRIGNCASIVTLIIGCGNRTKNTTEKQNVAQHHPAIVEQIAHIMKIAPKPSDRYPIGTIYQGKPIWNAH